MNAQGATANTCHGHWRSRLDLSIPEEDEEEASSASSHAPTEPVALIGIFSLGTHITG